MIVWYLIKLPALSAWIAILEADSVHVGQWMLSRPILVGPIAGLLCGDWAAGLALGALIELLTLESPVGAAMPLGACVAAACAAILAAGPHGLPPAAALPAGLLCGAGHRAIESRVRQWRAGLGRKALAALEADSAVEWEWSLLVGLGAHVLATAAWVYVAMALGGPAASILWSAGPEFLRAGLRVGYEASVFVGLGALAFALGRKG